MKKPATFAAGKPFFQQVTAGNLNTHSEAIRELQRALQDMRTDAAGVYMQFRLGIVTGAGPDNEDDDTTSNRYWVKIAGPEPTTGDGEALTLVEDSDPEAGGYVRATNLSEGATSHLVPVDETAYAHLFRIVSYHGVPLDHWFFFYGGAQQVITFKVVSAATGHAKYNAKSLDHSTISSDVSATTDAAEGQLGTLAADPDLLAINLNEVGDGRATPILGTTYYPQIFVGRHIHTNDNGLKVVVFNGQQVKVC